MALQRNQLLRPSRDLLVISFAVIAFLLPLTAAQADAIAITYNLSGTGTVVDSTPTTLTLNTMATGSILSDNSGLNAAWDPVSFSELCILDFTTNLLQGNFTLTLMNGDTLIGTDLSDQTAVDQSPDGIGPYTQTLVFTGGTGEFAGVTGSASGNGLVGTTGFTESGSGTLNTAPEPGPAVLLVTGMAVFGCSARVKQAFLFQFRRLVQQNRKESCS